MNGDYTGMKEQKKKTNKTTIMQLITMLLFGASVIIGCAKVDNSVPDCVVSNSLNDEYSLTIIANQDEIEDQEAFAKELISRVSNNEFKTIMFAFAETGYPTKLDMTVYLNEEDWKSHNAPYMNITFRQENILDGYNIVEHYDKFQMTIQ